MDTLDEPTVKLNFVIFSLFGHLPEAKVLHRAIVVPFSCIALTTVIYFQCMMLVTRGYQMKGLVETVPVIAIMLVCIAHIPIGYMNRHKYAKFIMMVKDSRREQITKTEEKIRRKYETRAIRVVQFTTLSGIIGGLVILLSGMAPQFLDLLMPLNETRPKMLPFPTVFFFDQEKYFYVIYLIEWAYSVIVISIICSIESIFVLAIGHIYGMLAIIGYRMENAANMYGEFEKQSDYEEYVSRTIRVCAKMHQTTNQMQSIINSCGQISICLCVAGTLSSFSVSLVAVMNPEFINMKCVLFTTSQIGQFFIINFAGEIIINASLNLSQYTYNAKWYYCPARLQRLFLFLHLQCRRVYKLEGLYMYILSLPNFSLVARTAVSYCMVIRQFQ